MKTADNFTLPAVSFLWGSFQPRHALSLRAILAFSGERM